MQLLCGEVAFPIGRFIVRGAQMNYQAFTKDSLTMMYEATPDWKMHAAELESEMLKRGMRFEVIDWSEDRPTG